MTQARTNHASDQSWALLDTAMDYNAKLLHFALDHIGANLDYAGKLSKVRSPSDFIDVTSNHLRDRFETFTEQMEEMTALIERAEPEALRDSESETATFFE